MRRTALLALLVAAALGGAVASAVVSGTAGGRGTKAGSSFRADESGLLAARRVLEELGWPVASRRGARLPEGTGHVLIRVEGLHRAEDDDTPEEETAAATADLVRWVRRGNAVLLVGRDVPRGSGWPAISQRRDASEREDEDEPADDDELDAEQTLSRLFGPDRPIVPRYDGADAVETSNVQGPGDPWISERFRVGAHAGDEVLCSAEGDDGAPLPVIVESAQGKGRVTVVADPFFLSNVRLANSDNPAWLAVLVARLARGGGVWFDDRAVGQRASRGVLSLLSEAGLGPALAAGFLLLGLVWWRAGPSDAPSRFVAPKLAYRPETFVHLRAELYVNCLSAPEAVRMVRDEVARRVGRGDSTSCERALALLAARDPDRARRIREALAALPSEKGRGPRRHPAQWCAAVARVWRELPGEVTEER